MNGENMARVLTSLTPGHSVRFHCGLLMRSLNWLVVLLVSSHGITALAAPKRRPAPAPAAKKAPPAAPASTPSGASGSSDGAPQADATAALPSRGPARIDFDDRLIQGQTNKSGSVYLYDRKEMKVRSMIKKRENFRDEIVGTLFDG